MNLAEVLQQPEGFTPPAVTVKIEKVYPYKSGESENGPWSFQDVQVIGGGKLKLKGLPEFPESRVGQTVTITANQSKQHGLTGMKVAHEKYQNKVYDKLVITSSAKWAWGSSQNGNGHSTPTETSVEYDASETPDAYRDHVLACAQIAEQVASGLKVADPAAIQACFATVVIDTKNRGLLLTKVASNGHQPEEENNDEKSDDHIPF